jgi:eukaryotic-like serine/threonine-protein kinase
VWKALRLEPRRQFVALKVLKPALTSNPSRMAQFRREAERGVRLEGPSLLPVFELDSIDGHHFMTMPYVQGITLREVIKGRLAHLRGGSTAAIHHLVTLDEPEYVRAMTRILAKAARALARVHDQQIAHRDIKPANILLENQRPEGVYLCDFGLGRDLEVATSEQMRDGAGTPMYMAPERLLRATADEVRCDIYSMGVTLFEALTLERPFQIPGYVSSQSLPVFLATARPRRPGAVRPGLPREHEAIILKAMAHDPGRRYESAHQLVADLDRIDDRGPSPCGRALFDAAHQPGGRGPHVLRGLAALSVRSRQ